MVTVLFLLLLLLPPLNFLPPNSGGEILPLPPLPLHVVEILGRIGGGGGQILPQLLIVAVLVPEDGQLVRLQNIEGLVVEMVVGVGGPRGGPGVGAGGGGRGGAGADPAAQRVVGESRGTVDAVGDGGAFEAVAGGAGGGAQYLGGGGMIQFKIVL